jgi:hypothetical protein
MFGYLFNFFWQMCYKRNIKNIQIENFDKKRLLFHLCKMNIKKRKKNKNLVKTTIKSLKNINK